MINEYPKTNGLAGFGVQGSGSLNKYCGEPPACVPESTIPGLADSIYQLALEIEEFMSNAKYALTGESQPKCGEVGQATPQPPAALEFRLGKIADSLDRARSDSRRISFKLGLTI